MFIHIGNNNILHSKEIIFIIAYDVITSSSIMEEMIAKSKEQNKVVKSEANVKSVVITNDLIYYSSLSVSTLKKRAKLSSIISKFENYSDQIK